MLFISHRSIDQAAAKELKRRALDRGYTTKQIFLSCDPESGIDAGADWEQVIRDGLNRCHALLVVATKNWRESKWCFAELVAAKTLGKPIFPILIEPCDVGPELGERQGVCVFDEGEAAYDRLWKSIEAHGLGPYETRPWPPDGGETCPYPGLSAFSERYAPVYFGREPETMAVLELLNTMRYCGEPRMLMIVGGSGSGKSSLLRAGVLPRLDRNPDWLVLPTLRYGLRPNEDLTILGLLAQELAARFPPDVLSQPDWKELRDKFETDNVEQAARDFVDVTQDLSIARGRHGATTLLPIDQFEELLTAASRPSAEQFLHFLRALLSRNNGRLLVIGTLRSDFLDVYERHPNALQPPYLQTYRLPPFPWERVTDVIVQPAARVGVTFTNELLERLKLDAPTSDALPLLAFTLKRLFCQCATDKLIELGEYKVVGGMTGAVAQAVSCILPPKLPLETEQALRVSFVRYLVQVNEKNEFVRRPARWSQLPDAARTLLGKFIKERLLHISGEGEAETVEVSHEALFRCWDKLARWLQDSRQVLQWRRDVERDRKSAGEAWSGLTRTQLIISRSWPKEIPDELSSEEIKWIRSAQRRSFLFRAGAVAASMLIAWLGTAVSLVSIAFFSHHQFQHTFTISPPELPDATSFAVNSTPSPFAMLWLNWNYPRTSAFILDAESANEKTCQSIANSVDARFVSLVGIDFREKQNEKSLLSILTSLSRIETLRVLKLTNVKGLSDVEIKAIAQIPSIETLYLDGSDVQLTSIAYLSSPNLKSLDISLLDLNGDLPAMHNVHKLTLTAPQQDTNAFQSLTSLRVKALKVYSPNTINYDWGALIHQVGHCESILAVDLPDEARSQTAAWKALVNANVNVSFDGAPAR